MAKQEVGRLLSLIIKQPDTCDSIFTRLTDGRCRRVFRLLVVPAGLKKVGILLDNMWGCTQRFDLSAVEPYGFSAQFLDLVVIVGTENKRSATSQKVFQPADTLFLERFIADRQPNNHVAFGGYGAPSERETGQIQDDIKNGYVTEKAARRDYGRS